MTNNKHNKGVWDVTACCFMIQWLNSGTKPKLSITHLKRREKLEHLSENSQIIWRKTPRPLSIHTLITAKLTRTTHAVFVLAFGHGVIVSRTLWQLLPALLASIEKTKQEQQVCWLRNRYGRSNIPLTIFQVILTLFLQWIVLIV